MCNPISLIITEDKAFLPPEKVWNHSHTFIMKTHNIPDGMIGDKYLRLEVTPPEENVFRNKETNEKLVVDHTWNVIVDETNIPEWYSNDLANQEDRAIEAVKKWFDSFPDNLLDGYKEIAGNGSKLTVRNCSTLTAGNGSTLTGGDYSTLTGGYSSKLTGEYSSTLTAGNSSTLTGGDYSTLTGGYSSKLTAGNGSTLTAGYNCTLTAGYNSILIAGDGSVFCSGEKSSFTSTYYDGNRNRTVTFYVGENGILPNKEYKISNGKIYDYETGKELKTKKTLKKKAKKNKE